MLVIDVSLSMNSTDVHPTRLAAAQDAAVSFARNLTPGINLGVESFAGSATVLVTLTRTTTRWCTLSKLSSWPNPPPPEMP